MKNILLYIAGVFICYSCAYGEGAANGGGLPSYVLNRAYELEGTGDLDQLIAAAGDRKLVLMGEASHGTREYYAWRDSISRRLIAEHGFRFIAVEGDWASLYELNRYVKDLPGAAGSAREVLEALGRWPLWMWGNEEVVVLAEWLRDFNDPLPLSEKVGFYGKDVYDEWNSMEQVLSFTREHAGDLYDRLSGYYACLEPYDGDSWQYAQMVARGAGDCVMALSAAVDLIRGASGMFGHLPPHAYFYLEQNALVVKHAEKFYRKSVTRQDASSWNSRVHYMNLTVNRLLDFYGPEAQGIVWAHNTHIGDARFTEMYQRRQENIGQLTRVEHGPDNVFLIGFTTYEGTVKAGAGWGERMQKMKVPPARSNSIEDIFRKTGLDRFYLLFDDADRTHEQFMQAYGNRAIGVVYNPRQDARQYVQTIVPLRYDAVMFFRETEALNPLIR